MSAGTLGSTSTSAFVGGGGALVKIGNAATDVVSAYGATGSVQMAHLTALAAPTTAGYASTAAAILAVAATNAILAYLQASGFMAAT